MLVAMLMCASAGLNAELLLLLVVVAGVGWRGVRGLDEDDADPGGKPFHREHGGHQIDEDGEGGERRDGEPAKERGKKGG